MTNKRFSRRGFFTKCFGGGTTVFGIALMLNSCNNNRSPSTSEIENKKQNSSQTSCEDLSQVSKEEIEKRESLGYVSKASNPENVCGKCSLFIPPGADKVCGGCLLFKGPVNAGGYCVQYAAKA